MTNKPKLGIKIMLSNLESLFYQDIELWDWESLLEEIEPYSTAVSKAKQSTWNVIRVHSDYSDVENISNVYATMLTMQIERVIKELLPSSDLVFEATINNLNTSLSVIVNDEEFDIKDIDDVVEVIKIASGCTDYAFILDEIRDCEFNDLDNPGDITDHRIVRELYDLNVESVINSQEIPTELAIALEQGVPTFLMFNGKLFSGVRHTAQAAIAVGRLITDYFLYTSSKVSIHENTISLEVMVNGKPYSIDSLDSFWEAWNAAHSKTIA